MKLNKRQKEILLKWGHTNEDISQIENAISFTTYTICNGKEKRIGRKKVIELLGEKEWLSGISRSSFHWTSYRKVNDNEIYFDTSKFFRR